MEGLFHNIVSFTASFDLWTILLLLTWCLIGEVGVSIPYVLESFWLLVGFNVGTGVLPPEYIFVLWLSAQAGRQAGSLGLYRIFRFGVPALTKFFHFIHLDRLVNKLKARSGIANRINVASPFSVAYGRMVGLRIPMMMVMSAKKKPGTLALGVLLSSVIWDGLYISLGAIFGANFNISPVYMLLISLGCITLIYFITWGIKKLIKYIVLRKPQSVPVAAMEVPAAVIKSPPLREYKIKGKRDLYVKGDRRPLFSFSAIVFNSLSKKFR